MHNKMPLRAKQFGDLLIICTLINYNMMFDQIIESVYQCVCTKSAWFAVGASDVV